MHHVCSSFVSRRALFSSLRGRPRSFPKKTSVPQASWPPAAAAASPFPRHVTRDILRRGIHIHVLARLLLRTCSRLILAARSPCEPTAWHEVTHTTRRDLTRREVEFLFLLDIPSTGRDYVNIQRLVAVERQVHVNERRPRGGRKLSSKGCRLPRHPFRREALGGEIPPTELFAMRIVPVQLRLTRNVLTRGLGSKPDVQLSETGPGRLRGSLGPRSHCVARASCLPS